MPPYNTRRKSLSLSELGITLPKRSRASEQQPSPPETVIEGEEPPVKRSKRAHELHSPTLGHISPPRASTVRIKAEHAKPVSALSPPPSPRAEVRNKIDTEGIHDDIVVATIEQLERTGNRPHMVKELAAVLALDLHAADKYAVDDLGSGVQGQVANKLARSANPCALISSRLTAYLNRPWPAISPCPLAKDLSSSHPRRLYFFLTTMPHQPIPAVAEPLPTAARIISPSLSSASAEEEDPRYARGRQTMSPSPEVDLSSPELDDGNPHTSPSTGTSFSAHNSYPCERSTYTHPRRAASPPLEHEERDFKQTASQLQAQAQARRQSQQDVDMGGANNTAPVTTSVKAASPPAIVVAGPSSAGAHDSDATSVNMSIDASNVESEESAARRNSEAAAALFGAVDHLRLSGLFPSSASATSLNAGVGSMDFSSPVIPPQRANTAAVANDTASQHSQPADHVEPMALDLDANAYASLAWDDRLQCPETIELDELDSMFDAC